MLPSEIKLEHKYKVKYNNKVYTLDFTKNLDWKAGDFGDSKSCFWKSHTGDRLSLQEQGCWAVRFYKARGGVARAWAWPYRKSFVLFNAYGYQLELIGNITAKLMDRHPHLVEVSEYEVVVNNEQGIFLGAEGTQINSIDLKAELVCVCVGCRKKLPSSKMKMVSYLEDESHFTKGLCKRCNLDIKCENCLSTKEPFTAKDEYIYHRYSTQTCPDCFAVRSFCYKCGVGRIEGSFMVQGVRTSLCEACSKGYGRW